MLPPGARRTRATFVAAMSLALAVTLVLAGLGALAAGGEALIRGATTLARLAGLTPAVIGLTVVALGTSLPELVVSLIAASEGSPAIAVGNVVGSNLFNVAVILGVTALVTPLPVRGAVVRVEWPFMFLASVLGAMVMRDLVVDRVEGGVFLLLLVGFIAFSVWLARREVRGAEQAQFESEVEARALPPRFPEGVTSAALLVAGLVLLVLGGSWLVDGSVAIARAAGMSERVIGLTIVAAGTSAPELAASLAAARARQADVAIGNIIGSNIFNVLGILGLTALVTPIAVPAEVLRGDIWWMLGTSLALFPMMRWGGAITRRDGALLLATYVAYLTLLLA